MTIRNLTPHPIRIYTLDTPDRVTNPNNGVIAELPADGPPVRIGMIELGTQLGYGATIGDRSIPVELVEYGRINGLPEPRDGVRLVVPLVVALAARRDDLLVPFLEVRNVEGAVVGCRMLAKPC